MAPCAVVTHPKSTTKYYLAILFVCDCLCFVFPPCDSLPQISVNTRMVLKSSKLPPLSSIETATLKAKDGTEVQAKTLWSDEPVFIYCIRRPGW